MSFLQNIANGKYTYVVTTLISYVLLLSYITPFNWSLIMSCSPDPSPYVCLLVSAHGSAHTGWHGIDFQGGRGRTVVGSWEKEDR